MKKVDLLLHGLQSNKKYQKTLKMIYLQNFKGHINIQSKNKIFIK
jgi:hypothetical protein